MLQIASAQCISVIPTDFLPRGGQDDALNVHAAKKTRRERARIALGALWGRLPFFARAHGGTIGQLASIVPVSRRP